jgi:AraC-like DNA-binding protein
MVLFDASPSLPLATYVRVYRIIQFTFTNSSTIPYKPYPPRPEHCLSFYPKDTETVQYADSGKTINSLQSVLIGQHNVVTNRYVGRDFLVIQVVFRPGALYKLTGIPASELNNQYIDAETVFSTPIRQVNERLRDAITIKEMIHIIEAFILKLVAVRKRDAHRIDDVSNLVLQAKENFRVEWLAKESCLSLRQYERKFIERIGIPPRYFNRIVRFENAYRIKNKMPHLDWLSIAVQAGYHDYQHLVRDYKEFTQKTPAQFHLLDLSAPERKFGEADTY